jgi:glycosyltransferase involved in cell wall biosynthesis
MNEVLREREAGAERAARLAPMRRPPTARSDAKVSARASPGSARRSRPRVCNVVHSLGAGGAEKLVFDMTVALARDFDIDVVCLDEPGARARELAATGIPVHCVHRRAGVDLAVAYRLAAHFRRRGVEVVHAHQCTAWIYSALARLVYPAPRLLLEEHGRFHPEVESRRRILANRWLLRRLTHRFVAVSDDVRQRLQRYEGLEEEHIEVVHNGVQDRTPLSPSVRTALRTSIGFGSDDFVVGTAGRFDGIKNLPLLIDSLARLAPEWPHVRGLLVGDGPELGAIETLVRQRGLADRVRLTGYRDDARDLIESMDLFVLSSFSEGTSVALLEAMAGGVPVVVTDVGGNPEVVLDDRTGIVVPSNSVGALSQAILDCMMCSATRERLATGARHRFLARFSFDRMLARYREQYEALCREPH